MTHKDTCHYKDEYTHMSPDGEVRCKCICTCPTIIKDFPGRLVDHHLKTTGKLPSEEGKSHVPEQMADPIYKALFEKWGLGAAETYWDVKWRIV